MDKASVGQRASQFLSQVGTAGGLAGAMTAPGLVAFGAGDIARQVMMGNGDHYMMQRMESPDPILTSNAAVGAPNHGLHPKLQSAPTMPDNLFNDYIRLNMPGSPLPAYGLMEAHAVKAAQVTQDNIRAMDQRMLTGNMPPTGELPLIPMQAAMGAAQQLTAQAAQRRGRR